MVFSSQQTINSELEAQSLPCDHEILEREHDFSLSRSFYPEATNKRGLIILSNIYLKIKECNAIKFQCKMQ